MASIDERVVAMSFENAKFEAGVAQTMATLGKLDAAIRNIGAVNGLSNIEAAANKVTLLGPMSALDRLRAKLGMAGSNAADGFGQIDQAANKVTLEGPSSALDRLRAKFGIGVTREAADAFSEVEKDADKVDLKGVNDAIDNTAGHFSVMSTAAAVALGNIASEAARKGLAVAKSFTLDPIKEGFKGYETQINAVQTIMANTGLKGQKGLGTVTATLKELQKYANQTVYNFSDMAKNIGTFTAAGVKLKPATESIKGIANLAALSGSSAQQASGAMYQLSQAIAAGKVNLQDWNSVTNAGIGGAVFQKNLVRTAMAMGTLNKGIVKGVDGTGKLTINGQTFRNSIASIPGGPPPWLTSKVLTTSLSTFTGDMTKAQLAALGFNDKAAKTILEQGKTAQDAATKIKTLSQMMEALKEEVATAYATIFKTIFGNFFQARDIFSKLHVVIENGLTKPIYAVNKLLEGWAKLGGRTKLIDALKQGFGDISALIKPVKDAFREVFPPASAKSLLNITNGFDRLMHSLRIGPETANNLKRTFAGVFAVLHIGVTIVTDIAKVLGHLLGVVGHGSGGIFAFTGGLGDMLVALDKAISSGKGLAGVFTGLESALKVPINLIKEFASAIAGLFGKNDRQGPQQFSDGIANLTKQFRPLAHVLTIVQAGFQGLKNFLANTGLDQMFTHLSDVVKNFAAKLGASFKNGDYKAVFAGIQTGLIGGIFLTLKKALGGGLSVDLGGGLLKNLNASLKVLTGTLVAMQKNIMAGTLLKIAEAIGILAISVFALSKVDPKRLGSSMTAISVGLGELIGAMKLLTGVGGKGAFATMPVIAASLIMLAGAVDVLAIAVFAFSKLSWMELVKGLAGVAGSLAAVGAGAKLISGPNLLAIGPGLILLGVGLNVVASAIVILGNMRFDKLLTGLFGIAGALAAMGLGMEAIGPDILIIGPGLIAVGIGLTFLAGAVGTFARIPVGNLVKGIIGLGAALVVLGLAIEAIPPTVALQAAGLVVLSVALVGIASAIGILGSMKVGTIVKGIIGMGGALVVLAVGLTAMTGTLPGAAALLAAAAAFAILGPALGFMGQLKWETIGKGLVAIAAVLGVLAIAGGLAAVPLAALGAALVVLGIGMAAISASIYILAAGISLLASDGQKGIAVLLVAMTGFVAMLPKIIINFLQGLVSVITGLAELAPKVVTAVVGIVNSIIQVVIDSAPGLALAVVVLIGAFLKVIDQSAGPILNSGIKLLLKFLEGIASNIGKVTEQAGVIIIRFLDKINRELPQIVRSGARMLTTFLKGIATQIPQLIAAGAAIVVNFLGGIATKIPKVVASAARVMVNFLTSIAAHIPDVVAAGTHAVVRFIDGLANGLPDVLKAAGRLAGRFVSGLANGLVQLVDIGARAVIRFLNGLAAAIRQYEPQLMQAGWNIASAIVEGMVKGFAGMAHRAIDAVGNLVKALPHKALQLLGIHSPSTVFRDIGMYAMQGLVVGVQGQSGAVARSATDAANGLTSAVADSLNKMPDMLGGLADLNPTITPVLDLTNVQQGAKKLSDLTNVTPITAAASFGQASAISQAQQAAADAQAASTPGTTFTFEQNNYSPKALSEVEVYRQTKNQLAQAKSALGLSA